MRFENNLCSWFFCCTILRAVGADVCKYRVLGIFSAALEAKFFYRTVNVKLAFASLSCCSFVSFAGKLVSRHRNVSWRSFFLQMQERLHRSAAQRVSSSSLFLLDGKEQKDVQAAFSTRAVSSKFFLPAQSRKRLWTGCSVLAMNGKMIQKVTRCVWLIADFLLQRSFGVMRLLVWQISGFTWKEAS